MMTNPQKLIGRRVSFVGRWHGEIGVVVSTKDNQLYIQTVSTHLRIVVIKYNKVNAPNGKPLTKK
jgi:hypothetical protein